MTILPPGRALPKLSSTSRRGEEPKSQLHTIQELLAGQGVDYPSEPTNRGKSRRALCRPLRFEMTPSGRPRGCQSRRRRFRATIAARNRIDGDRLFRELKRAAHLVAREGHLASLIGRRPVAFDCPLHHARQPLRGCRRRTRSTARRTRTSSGSSRRNALGAAIVREVAADEVRPMGSKVRPRNQVADGPTKGHWPTPTRRCGQRAAATTATRGSGSRACWPHQHMASQPSQTVDERQGSESHPLARRSERRRAGI